MGPGGGCLARKLHQHIAQSVPMGASFVKILAVAVALALDVAAVAVA
jgi:hypothetical protein